VRLLVRSLFEAPRKAADNFDGVAAAPLVVQVNVLEAAGIFT
jgi:hypothetical protein